MSESNGVHDYDGLDLCFRFRVRGKAWTLRSPPAMARVRMLAIQLEGAEGEPGSEGFKAKPEQLERGNCAYVAACVVGADGSSPSQEEVEGWPSPVVDDLQRRVNEHVRAASKNSPGGAETTSPPPAS